MNWIFKSFKQDFLKLYLTGIVAYAFFLLLRGAGADEWGLVLFNFILSGVYFGAFKPQKLI